MIVEVAETETVSGSCIATINTETIHIIIHFTGASKQTNNNKKHHQNNKNIIVVLVAGPSSTYLGKVPRHQEEEKKDKDFTPKVL